MFKVLKYSQMLSAQCRTIFRNDLCQLPAQHQILVNKFHKSSSFYSKKDDSHSNDPNATEVTPTIASKYERFTDDKATIILDIEEERDKMLAGAMEIEDTTPNIFEGLNTERGKTGVFDIEDLVAVLKRDNAENIFVCTVPKELKYVDYLCVITAKSPRHMRAISEFVRKMFKIKGDKKDILPKIEGKNSDEWIAMDLGNIALHIFSAKIRKQYDIEMLWSVGPEYDNEVNKPDDPITGLFDQHSFTLDASSSSPSSPHTITENSLISENDVNLTTDTPTNEKKY